jgi:hypothetical protein
MKYTKPQIALKNAALSVIQGVQKAGITFDNLALRTHTTPAYEADE